MGAPGVTKLEMTFKAGGMPAMARGAMTSEGNRGRAKRKVANTRGPARRPESGPCRDNTCLGSFILLIDVLGRSYC